MRNGVLVLMTDSLATKETGITPGMSHVPSPPFLYYAFP